jgi:uncharacterized membrane protein
MMKLALMLHLLGVVIWVGGMFFAYMALRPAASRLLEPPQRLPLWAATLGRFFNWVWLCVVLVLGSGFYMLSVMGDLGKVPVGIHAMLYVGIVMTLIFGYVFAVMFSALKRAIASGNWKEGGAALNQIRIAVAINLSLGLLNIVIATAGAM